MPLPTYPDVLKQSNWDKNKGILAKMARYTGVGDAMKAAQAAYSQVKPEIFSPGMTYKSWDEFNTAFEKAKADYGKVESAITAVRQVQKVASDAKTKYGGNPLLKSAVKLCDDVAKEADKFAIKVKSIDELWKTTEKAIKNKFELAKKNIKDGIDLCEKAAPGVDKDPTPNYYKDNFWQKLRTLSAAVQVNPDYSGKWQPIFKPLSSIQPQTLKDPIMMKEHMKKVMDAVGKLKAEVK